MNACVCGLFFNVACDPFIHLGHVVNVMVHHTDHLDLKGTCQQTIFLLVNVDIRVTHLINTKSYYTKTKILAMHSYHFRLTSPKGVSPRTGNMEKWNTSVICNQKRNDSIFQNSDFFIISGNFKISELGSFIKKSAFNISVFVSGKRSQKSVYKDR
jgi:hypothetical protein